MKNNNHEGSVQLPSGYFAPPKYRPDIDGLRAIAVLSVVIFHAFPNVLKGGFVGVDIFFVISGFLISSIIFNNFQCNNFSFYIFYSRRILRIFPSLLFVLISCYVFGWFSLFPDEYEQLGKHIAAGAGFVSNLVLWGESGYFDSSAENKPLLHLWSLGIEEQFYIIWPLALWVVWKKKFDFFTISVVLFVVSFSINLFKVSTDGAAGFYSPQTRFWELLAGSLLAYLKRTDSTVPEILGAQFKFWRGGIFARLPLSILDFFSFSGVLLVALGLVFITKERAFPGFWAALPVIGAVCIIASGPNSWFNRIVLSNRFMVWFGIISFPLYLWHWPLLSFLRIVEGGLPSRFVRIAAIFASIILAWLTYRIIEQPLRFGGRGRLKVFLLILAMALLGGAGYKTYQRDGRQFEWAKLKKSHPWPNEMQNKDYEFSDLFRSAWQDVKPEKSRDFLLSSSSEKQWTVAVIGDSHANRLYLGLKAAGLPSILNVGKGTCPPFLGVDVFRGMESLSCQPLTNNYLRFIKNNNDIKIIVINAYYAQYGRDVSIYSGGDLIKSADAIAKTVQYFYGTEKTIVVALDVPEVSVDCYKKSNARKLPVWKTDGLENDKYCYVSRGELAIFKEEVLSSILRINGKSRDVFVVDPADVLCKNDMCGEVDPENYLYYYDGNHLNELGVRIVGEWLIKELRKIQGLKDITS